MLCVVSRIKEGRTLIAEEDAWRGFTANVTSLTHEPRMTKHIVAELLPRTTIIK